MRRKVALWAGVLVIAVLCMAAAATYFWEGNAGAEPECPERRPIVIDPGHGGIDGGTNLGEVLEKDLVLDVALRTKKYLDRYKVPAMLTRTEDVDLGGANDMGRLRRDLNYRIRVANHCQSVLMLSLHVNSATDAAERGVMIFYQPSRASHDAAMLFDDILRRWPVHERRESPHPRGNFAVLRGPKSPAILVELGFITNAADRALLTDPNYREKLAQALSSGCAAIYHKWM